MGRFSQRSRQTHETLMREDGIYAGLFTLQAAAYLGDSERGRLAEEDLVMRSEGDGQDPSVTA